MGGLAIAATAGPRDGLSRTAGRAYEAAMPVVDLIDLPAASGANVPVVGLDLGEKTIGVAVSDATRMIASPLETIRKGKFTDCLLYTSPSPRDS